MRGGWTVGTGCDKGYLQSRVTAFKRLFAGVTASHWSACRRTVILLDMHAMEPLLWTTCSPSPTVSEAISALCRHGGR